MTRPDKKPNSERDGDTAVSLVRTKRARDRFSEHNKFELCSRSVHCEGCNSVELNRANLTSSFE